jgi:hypothetical protein
MAMGQHGAFFRAGTSNLSATGAPHTDLERGALPPTISETLGTQNAPSTKRSQEGSCARALTSAVHAKVALDAELLRRLAHRVHALLDVVARVARPAHDGAHPFDPRPALEADVAHPGPVAEVADGAAEERVSLDRRETQDAITTQRPRDDRALGDAPGSSGWRRPCPCPGACAGWTAGSASGARGRA